MRTVRSSSRLLGGVCLSACWDTPPQAWSPWAWAWTPPGPGPGHPSLWAEWLTDRYKNITFANFVCRRNTFLGLLLCYPHPTALADPSRSNFFHVHAVFGTILPNNGFSAQTQGLVPPPPVWEILDPPLHRRVLPTPEIDCYAVGAPVQELIEFIEVLES